MPQPLAPSYWQASTPAFAGGCSEPVAGAVDVAVIGGGFTGLSAALALAKSGASVAVLEAAQVMGAASGRNGGQCNAGTAHDFGALAATYGIDRARKWYLAHCDAVDTVERIAREEEIDCAFQRCGRAKLAAKPEHFAKLEAAYALLAAEVDPNVSLVPPERIGEEIEVGRISRRADPAHICAVACRALWPWSRAGSSAGGRAGVGTGSGDRDGENRRRLVA